MKKTLLIAGATGLTGGTVLDLAREDERYSQIILLVRRSLGINHAKVREMIVDFEHLAGVESDIIVDDVVIALGTTIGKAGSKAAFEKVDLHAVTATAEWALRHGAKQCALVSSVGADADSGNFYLRTKGRAESHLQSLGFQKLVIFRPGLLLGERQEFRLGERYAQILFGKWTQNWSLFGKYTSIHVHQLAKAMLGSLNDSRLGTTVMHFNEMKQYF